MKILCLDLSINQPGFCIGDTETETVIDYGYITNKSGEGVYSRIEKNLNFFLDLVPKYQIEAVWLELPIFKRASKTTLMLIEQQGVFKFAFQQINIPMHGVSITDIKKHLAGKGTATKQEMIRAARDLGYAVTKDDEADAIGIFLTGMTKPFLEEVNQ